MEITLEDHRPQIDETAWVAEELRERFGAERVQHRPDPLMGSEDFSFVLQEVPGSFFFLQCSPPEVDPETAPWNHSAEVLFDDGFLGDQAAALAHLAIRRLELAAGERLERAAGGR